MRTGGVLVQFFLCSKNSERLKSSAQHFSQTWVSSRRSRFIVASSIRGFTGAPRSPAAGAAGAASAGSGVGCCGGCSPWSSSESMCWGFACLRLDMVRAWGAGRAAFICPLRHKFLELGNLPPFGRNAHVPVISSAYLNFPTGLLQNLTLTIWALSFFLPYICIKRRERQIIFANAIPWVLD
jgi:hypothetical protein